MGAQLQIGLWLITWQREDIPHEPGQGSLHFIFMQASFNEQSVLTVHSGRHAGGFPIYPGTHEQMACPLNS